MSLYNNCGPFTSHLEMWSPSSSTNDMYSIITPNMFSATPESHLDYSRFYHHEPVFYPAGCMICGLSHQPIMTHTITEQTTPAPKPSPSVRRTRLIQQNKSKPFIRSIRYTLHKFIRICTSFKISFSIKSHNVYPVKRKTLL